MWKGVIIGLWVASGAGAAAAPPLADGYVGVILGAETRDVAPRVAGRLVGVEVRIGDHVRQGDLLARIDDRTVRRNLEIAESELEAARAALREAEADLTLARSAYDRREGAPTLFSQEEILVAREQANAAAAAAEGAKAAVREAELRADQGREDLEATRLRSPVNGIVAARLREPGMNVEAGDAVVRISSEGAQWVRFAVPPEEASGLKPGTPVVVFGREPGARLRATVRNVSPEADEVSGMVFAEALLETDAEAGPAPVGGTVRVRAAERSSSP